MLKQEIIRLAQNKHTSGQIAAALSLTRNQVIGVIYRARKKGTNIPRSGVINRYGLAKPKVKTVAPSKPVQSKPILDEPAPLGPVGDFPPRGTCRYMRKPFAADFQMCGHPGHPWCEFHRKIVYDKARKAA